MQPQQLDSLMGKVLRINADGSVPKDNPFVGRADARPEIFALGIRDDQGIAIQPKTGRLWVSEHGPRGGDEINEIEKGKNYGFPVIGYGRDYTGKPINGDKTAQAGLEQPVYFWTPDIAPAGIGFYTGKMFPAWDGDLFVAGLASKNLVRLVLNGERVSPKSGCSTDLNTRIRGVSEGPDGALYVHDGWDGWEDTQAGREEIGTRGSGLGTRDSGLGARTRDSGSALVARPFPPSPRLRRTAEALAEAGQGRVNPARQSTAMTTPGGSRPVPGNAVSDSKDTPAATGPSRTGKTLTIRSARPVGSR